MDLIGELMSGNLHRSYGPYRDCPTVMQMAAYSGVAGEISPRQRARIDSHLEGCEDCQYAIDQLVAFNAEAEKSPSPMSDAEFGEYLDCLMQRVAP